MPPYSSGNGSPNRPISAMPLTTSYGNVWFLSCSAETGATTFWLKSRTIFCRSAYSSGRLSAARNDVFMGFSFIREEVGVLVSARVTRRG